MAAPHMRIGLLGGSFNPPHEAHLEISLTARKRLGLDQVWWLVSPGNPLKDPAALAPFERRLRRAAKVAGHPRIVITGAEAALGTRYTADILGTLARRRPAGRFVWVMGSDNLAQFDRWERWRDIAVTVPIAVVNRPGYLLAALSSPAAQALRNYRIDERCATRLADAAPPVWCFIIAPRTGLSSTALRAAEPAPVGAS
jgi:nicotinate-nucleotide adenylyltransferase